MKKVIKNSSLSIVLLIIFVFTIMGQFNKGFETYNDERETKKLPPIESKIDYLQSGHFISSVSENMESEFLQMCLFVYLTMFLYQKRSAESQKPEEGKNAQDRAVEKKEKEYSEAQRKKFPILWRLYENSLTLSLLFLFFVFFVLHAMEV